MKFVNLSTLLASQEDRRSPPTGLFTAAAQESSRSPRCGEVAANWSSAQTEDAMTLLHRVVLYGDHMDVRHLAKLMGFRCSRKAGLVAAGAVHGNAVQARTPERGSI